MSWVISCCFVSLAGALYALLNNFVDPRALYWTQSGDFVIMAVLGGMRSFWGPLIGAAIFVANKLGGGRIASRSNAAEGLSS